MTSRLDELFALAPKAKLFEADFVARFDSASPHEIESRALEGLEEMLWVMCQLSFGQRSRSRQTIAGLLNNDVFALSAVYLGRLKPAEADPQACLDAIVDLLIRSTVDPDRPRNEVKSELVAAYLLASALRSVRSGAARWATSSRRSCCATISIDHLPRMRACSTSCTRSGDGSCRAHGSRPAQKKSPNREVRAGSTKASRLTAGDR